MLLYACKKTTGVTIPTGLSGHWSINSVTQVYNYRDGHTLKDTVPTKVGAGYYEFADDGTYRELDAESSYVIAGSFSAILDGSTLKFTFNGNNGIIKNSTGIFVPGNGLNISSITELPGDPKVASITTTQYTVKK